jgi:type IV pilus assembly protein PilC
MGAAFEYRAWNQDGKIVCGRVEAASSQDAVELLRLQGLVVVKITRARQPVMSLFTRKVGTKELAVFCRQFAIMISAGVSLPRCLLTLQGQTKDLLLKRITEEAVMSLERGESLAEAFSVNSEHLPPLLINMLKAAEASGSLDQTLERLADSFEKDAAVREKIKSALAYPLLVTAAALLSIVVLLVYVVPIFVDVFEHTGTALPAPTQLLLAVSSLLRLHWPALLLILLLIVIALKFAQRTSKYRFLQDLLCLKLPGIGSVAAGITISRFARTLSLFLKSGIPLLESLSVMEKIIGNSIAAREIKDAQMLLESGGSIAHSFQNSLVFPAMVTSMMVIGDEAGELEQILDKLANYYDQDVEQAIVRLASLLEPLLITGVGLLVGFIALSIYLPLFGLSGTMQ